MLSKMFQTTTASVCNKIYKLEFELAYFETEVQHFNHYTT